MFVITSSRKFCICSVCLFELVFSSARSAFIEFYNNAIISNEFSEPLITEFPNKMKYVLLDSGFFVKYLAISLNNVLTRKIPPFYT